MSSKQPTQVQQPTDTLNVRCKSSLFVLESFACSSLFCECNKCIITGRRMCSNVDASGYADVRGGPGSGNSNGSDAIDLRVLCLNGEGLTLKCLPSTLGREVRQLVVDQLPPKAGAKIILHSVDSELTLNKTLQQQGIMGEMATLSCTFVPTNVHAAWRFIHGLATEDEDYSLEGVTTLSHLHNSGVRHVPKSLQKLMLSSNSQIKDLDLPCSLESLSVWGTFVRLQNLNLPVQLRELSLCFKPDFSDKMIDFSKILAQVPLQHLTLSGGCIRNLNLKCATFPPTLETLVLGDFYGSLKSVNFPATLRSLTVGDEFNHSLHGVNLPASLRNLKFGRAFNQSFQGVVLPRNLQELTFGDDFNHSLEGVELPASLGSLTFGWHFNQSLDRMALPKGLGRLVLGPERTHRRVPMPTTLQSLTSGGNFESLDIVRWPDSLRSLTLGGFFNQRLKPGALPGNLQTLIFGDEFNQSLEGVRFPASLQNLTFGRDFSVSRNRDVLDLPQSLQSLHFCPEETSRARGEGLYDVILYAIGPPPPPPPGGAGEWPVVLPNSLQSLTLDFGFNDSLQNMKWPTTLRSLTFGHAFNQILTGMAFPAGLEHLTFGYAFNRSVEGLAFPAGLQRLKFGHSFDQSVERMTLPLGIQSLTFGPRFRQSIEHLSLPSSLSELTFGSSFPLRQLPQQMTLPSTVKCLVVDGDTVSCL